MSLLTLTNAALAQQQTPPRPYYYIGDGEVELWMGTFMYSNTDITIGGSESDGGLAFTRYNSVREFGPLALKTGHSLEVMIIRDRYKEEGAGQGMFNYRYYVVQGRSVEIFEQYYGNNAIYGKPESYGTLTKSGADGPYIFAGRDGSIINFDAIALSDCAIGNCIARASKVTRPNGLVTQFFYDTSSKKLRLVATNRGFGMGIEYNTEGKISRVCAVNVSQVYASSSAPCPSGVPSATYSYGKDPVTYVDWWTFTDANGKTTTYTKGGDGSIGTIKGPGSTVNDLTVAYHVPSGRVASLTYADGTSTSYLYANMEADPLNEIGNIWTDVTDPSGKTTRHVTGRAPFPGAIIDPLNRTSSIGYKPEWPRPLVVRRTSPEGDYILYTHDTRENVTETRVVAKPGSGQADIVSSATFPTPCTNLVVCDLPLSTTDPRGNTSDFTYSATHGGVLTATGPAVGGIRPQKRYAYVQRYAWIKTSGGGYSQAATPVWLLSEERSCRTTATVGNACAGGAADEVVITYDYGPDAGPNNLLLRGTVVTATDDGVTTSLRTCYGYDARGDKIWETAPRAGLTSCS
ncbi:hypothetical protein [Sphingomonas sp.]|uniref:hypothetical protein n=1 Tax=Sphingomonas sp. TaxID=28214 RepID=UPI003F71D367